METIGLLSRRIVFCLALVILGCEDDDGGKTKYEMTYTLILSGDENLTSMTMHTWTVFPEENVTEWIGKTKRKIYSDNDEYYLRDNDTLLIQPSNQVYEKCTKTVVVTLRFNEGSDHEKYRGYEIAIDTIYGREDAKFVFLWPEDSAKYEYIEK